jgi:hypothetical protein
MLETPTNENITQSHRALTPLVRAHKTATYILKSKEKSPAAKIKSSNRG